MTSEATTNVIDILKELEHGGGVESISFHSNKFNQPIIYINGHLDKPLKLDLKTMEVNGKL